MKREFIPKCVLITGAFGFLGKFVTSKVMSPRMGVRKVVCVGRNTAHDIANEKVECVLGDLADPVFVKTLLATHRPDCIIHLASNPIVKLDEEHPHRIIHDNVVSIANLLAFAPQDCVFINASSATVYGNIADSIIGVSDRCPHNPNSVYGATKSASEHLLNAHKHLGRVRGVNLRLVANVSERATHGLVRDIIKKLKSNSDTLELLGDHPGSRKPFVHATDTAKAFVLAMSQPEWWRHDAVNISSRTTITVEEVARIVMQEMGIRKLISWAGSAANWKGDNPFVNVSSELAYRLGWQPRFSSSESAVRYAASEYRRFGE